MRVEVVSSDKPPRHMMAVMMHCPSRAMDLKLNCFFADFAFPSHRRQRTTLLQDEKQRLIFRPQS